MNVNKIYHIYRNNFDLKEDRDFILQTIKNCNGIVKFNKLFYNCPGVGKNKGGLYNDYKIKKDEESAKKMCKEWYPFITLQHKQDRIDIKTDIKKLAIYYNRVVK